MPHRLAARPPQFDLQAALDDPVRGAEWDWPLRLIARWHCAIDIFAPVLFRVNKQFEYCWRLAVQTNQIDLRAHKMWIRDNPVYRPPTSPQRKQDNHTAPQPLYPSVESNRRICKNVHMTNGFEVKLLRGPVSDSTACVMYNGSIDVHVPPLVAIHGLWEALH